MSVVSIHQPNFLPWIKLIDKILASDVYIAYDTVQFTRSEYHSRQMIKTPAGPLVISIPVLSGDTPFQNLVDVRIDPKGNWRRKQLKSIALSYAKAPFFAEVFSWIEAIYGRQHEWLVELNLDIIAGVCAYLQSQVRIVRASSLPHGGDNTERVIQLVQAVGGTIHLTSTYGTERQYIDWPRVTAAGLGIRVQQYQHPVYPQQYGSFVSNISLVDMLFNCGRTTAQLLARQRSALDITPGST